MAGGIDCIYWRGLLQLPSDLDKAMREASDGRTVTIQIPALFCL